MGLLDELMNGGEQQQSFREFADRYSQGAPYDGISDDEAVSRYGQVAGEVDPATYQDSARDALANMAPDEREQYAQQLGAAADQQGIGHTWDGRSTDPESLAAMTSTVHQQNPDLLAGLLGGGTSGAQGWEACSAVGEAVASETCSVAGRAPAAGWAECSAVLKVADRVEATR